MVFSIAPGIYLPGEFGTGVEGMILLRKAGAERLTESSQESKALN